MSKNEVKPKIGGYFIPTFLFIGAGLGAIMDEFFGGFLLGLGLGFLALLIARVKGR